MTLPKLCPFCNAQPHHHTPNNEVFCAGWGSNYHPIICLPFDQWQQRATVAPAILPPIVAELLETIAKQGTAINQAKALATFINQTTHAKAYGQGAANGWKVADTMPDILLQIDDMVADMFNRIDYANKQVSDRGEAIERQGMTISKLQHENDELTVAVDRLVNPPMFNSRRVQPRPCTCHPDAGISPCAQKYAQSECEHVTFEPNEALIKQLIILNKSVRELPQNFRADLEKYLTIDAVNDRPNTR